MYCTNCGIHLDDDAVFCTNCGHKVGTQQVHRENIFDNIGDSYNRIMARPKSKLIAGILAIVLGSRGIHDFYLGYTSKGVAHLLMYVFFLGWASQIWALVEALYIFTGKISTDADGLPLTDGF
ncbi:MAG: NINE protein [Oscillospiraceae bacterium]|nr:NINE protein [Oscillospiraceae bacterium]